MKLSIKSSHIRKFTPEIYGATPALLSFLTACLHSAWSSPALERFYKGLEDVKLTEEQSSWIVTIASFGSIFGVLIMFLIKNRMGPKTNLMISMVPMIIGWFMIYFAQSYMLLLTAKVLAGVGQGLNALNGPIYLAEISSDEFRGTITMLVQVMMALAPLIEFILVPMTNAKSSAFISGVLTLLVFILMFFSHESPYYSAAKNKLDELEATLKAVRKGDVAEEVKNIKVTVDLQANMNNDGSNSHLWSVLNKTNRKPLLIMMAIFLFQCFCGTAFMEIFLHVIVASINYPISTDKVAFGLIVLAIISSSISAAIIDQCGVRFLMILSSLSCTVTLFLLGIFFHLQILKFESETFSLFAIIILVLFKFLHGLGILGAPFKLVGEIFSTDIKAIGVTISKLFMFGCIFGTNVIFQTVMLGMGKHIVFYVMALGSLLGTIFIHVFVPETKGKSFLQVQEALGIKLKDLNTGA